jgi:hypothetical protein
MDASRREAQVRSFIEAVWNRKSYDAAADLYGETYRNGLGSGPSARSEIVRRYHQAFPDLRPGYRRTDRGGRHRGAQGDDPRDGHGWICGTAPHGSSGRGMGGHRHALRARPGREEVGRRRQVGSFHPTRGGRKPLAGVNEAGDSNRHTTAVGNVVTPINSIGPAPYVLICRSMAGWSHPTSVIA